MIDWYTSEPMKYWAFPASYSAQRRKDELQTMIDSGNYIYSQKWDGNWSRAIVGTDHNVLQTRGISKVTGTYGEVQKKVTWWNSVVSAFSKPTVIIGEIYIEGGVDRDIGSILRCLDDKALARQKTKPARWRIFDVLCYEGTDLHDLPIIERVKFIRQVVARINNPLVTGNTYYLADNTTYDVLSQIFANGGEGIVMYRKDSTYEPGKRTARMTCKIKKELEQDADVVCMGVTPATREYTGKEIEYWEYWQNLKTGEKIKGAYYLEYIQNHAYEPITKSFYYGWPGAIQCGAYNADGKLVHVCDVSGINESLRQDLLDNLDNYLFRPLKVTAMEVTPDGSLRHPRFMGFRDDIAGSDCTLSKIIGEV